MIHRIRVQNFKSLIDVTVTLAPVTVLVGRSGTGKSNFVQCLRVLRDILSSPQQQQALKTVWTHYAPATRPGAQTQFDVEFSVNGIAERYTYQLTLSKTGPAAPPVEECLQLGSKVLFHQRVIEDRKATPQWIVEPNLLQVPKPGPIALGRIPSISEVVIAFTALTTGTGCYAFSDNVLATGKPSQVSQGLDDGATNYLDALRDIVSNLQDLTVRRSIVGTLQRVNSSVAAVELDSIQTPRNVIVGHSFSGKILELHLSQESAGFRRFYAHLLALYQRPPKQTLTFEHPEDGIHPGALIVLAEEFQAASQQGRGQIVLTTHSPKLLDHFDVDQIRVVELDGLETRIGPVSREQQQAIQEHLLDPGELLTVDPARIESALPK